MYWSDVSFLFSLNYKCNQEIVTATAGNKRINNKLVKETIKP